MGEVMSEVPALGEVRRFWSDSMVEDYCKPAKPLPTFEEEGIIGYALYRTSPTKREPIHVLHKSGVEMLVSAAPLWDKLASYHLGVSRRMQFVGQVVDGTAPIAGGEWVSWNGGLICVASDNKVAVVLKECLLTPTVATNVDPSTGYEVESPSTKAEEFSDVTGYGWDCKEPMFWRLHHEDGNVTMVEMDSPLGKRFEEYIERKQDEAASLKAFDQKQTLRTIIIDALDIGLATQKVGGQIAAYKIEEKANNWIDVHIVKRAFVAAIQLTINTLGKRVSEQTEIINLGPLPTSLEKTANE